MGDNMADLCECVRQTIRRHMAAVESILSNVGSQDSVSSDGSFDGLQPRTGAGDGISPAMVVTAVLVLLFTVFMLSAGRQAGPRHVEDPATEKRGRGGGGDGSGGDGDGAGFFDDAGPGVH